MVVAVREVEVVEQFLGTFLSLLLVLASDEGRDADVFQRCELGQELMELEDEAKVLVAELGDVLVFQAGYIDAIDNDGTCIGRVEGTHNLEEGGLSGSRRTNDADHFALVDVEVNAFEHLERAEGLGDVFYFNHINQFFYVSLQNRYLIDSLPHPISPIHLLSHLPTRVLPDLVSKWCGSANACISLFSSCWSG